MFQQLLPAWILFAALPVIAQELTSEQQMLVAEAAQIDREASELYQRGQSAGAAVKARDAMAMYRKLYPDGHANLATSIANLGFYLHAAGALEKAWPCYEEALAMRQKLYPVSRFPDGHPDLAQSLNHMGGLPLAMALPTKALPYFEHALAMRQKLYPMSKYPDGHPDVATSLNNMGGLLHAMGLSSKALPYFEEALAIQQKMFSASKYPDGHPNLAASLTNMGGLLKAMGSYPKALPYYEQALAMQQHLYPKSKYPDGHPSLAIGLNNMGTLLHAMNSYSKALPYYEQALAMRHELYPASKHPDGHPHLATSLNNLGTLMYAMGSFPQALPHFEQALAMRQRLYPTSKYPDGHPELAESLNNIGGLLETMTLYPKALPYYEQALAMRQRLYPASKYPGGHPELAESLEQLGGLRAAMGMYEKALAHCQQAAAMRRAIGRQMMATASEAEALAFASAQPLTGDALLTLTAILPGNDVVAYGSVWVGKSAITRVLEQRHAAARVAGTEYAAEMVELTSLRRRIDQLLQDRRLPVEDRDRLLTQTADQRDTRERDLAKKLPMLQRAKDLDALGSEALGPLLPEHSVLIDFVRYTRFDYDKAKPDNGDSRRTASYAAFVLAKGLPIRRIELGAAKPIDEAVGKWRTTIETRAENSAADQLRDLVWSKLAPHLPAGTKTLYLSPDGDLARMPWAALPIAENRVLLEDYAVAMVPHGSFLLEQLKYPQAAAHGESILAVGNIAYNSKTWPNLPGTAVELKAFASRWPVALTGTEATAARVLAELPKVRYAHFATHGFFDAESLAAEKKREAEAMANRQVGDNSRRVAAKNPLAFNGLVLANGEVLTGLHLVDLPLENLKLVTLSACETGLGELTGGEGVQGLQRAFHLAGCPNVIASLWNVNDAATAALMAKFYHELWVNKKEPLAALRDAQLTIHYRPELIPALAGDRGAPRFKEAVALKSEAVLRGPGKPPPTQGDPKLWAAFVLSGVGK